MAPSALELLHPLRGALVPVPAVQAGICRVCHSATKELRFQTCARCEFDAAKIGPSEVLPITMAIKGDQVDHHLRSYKNLAIPETARIQHTTRLAALLAVLLANHSQCLGEWDYAACVPSPNRSAPAAVAERTQRLNGTVRQPLSATPGNWSRQFTTQRFALTEPVSGDRVLLIEDTYASGASVHSAAAVLRAGGAKVIGPLVLGRHVDPGWGPSAQMLDWLKGRRWDPARCARCEGEMRDPSAPSSLF